MCWRLVHSEERGQMTSVSVEKHLLGMTNSVCLFLLDIPSSFSFYFPLHQKATERSNSLPTGSQTLELITYRTACVRLCVRGLYVFVRVWCSSRPPPGDALSSPYSSSVVNPVTTQSTQQRGSVNTGVPPRDLYSFKGHRSLCYTLIFHSGLQLSFIK